MDNFKPLQHDTFVPRWHVEDEVLVFSERGDRIADLTPPEGCPDGVCWETREHAAVMVAAAPVMYAMLRRLRGYLFCNTIQGKVKFPDIDKVMLDLDYAIKLAEKQPDDK